MREPVTRQVRPGAKEGERPATRNNKASEREKRVSIDIQFEPKGVGGKGRPRPQKPHVQKKGERRRHKNLAKGRPQDGLKNAHSCL